MPPLIKAIIFDLDNTLLDFMELKKRACEAAITAMIDAGLKMEKEKALEGLYALYDHHGIEDHTIFQKFLQQVIGEISYPLLAAGIIAYRNVKASYLVPYPHVHQTLMELKRRGIKLAILTDAPRMNAWLRIAALRLIPYFEIVTTFDDTQQKKPSSVPFQLILKQLQLLPSSCLMVGDMVERDINGAKCVGMKTCYARYGAVKNKTASEADYIIDDISDLLSIISM